MKKILSVRKPGDLGYIRGECSICPPLVPEISSLDDPEERKKKTSSKIFELVVTASNAHRYVVRMCSTHLDSMCDQALEIQSQLWAEE